MGLRLHSCIAQHQGDRHEQQDRVALVTHRTIKGSCLAIVADGMGGYSGGIQASEQVVLSVSNAFQSWGIANDPRELMQGVLVEAHEMIRNFRCLNEQDPHSTAVLFMLLPDKSCFWSHCGDSRLYCFRGRRMLFRTRDHSYMEYLIQQGQISREEAKTHPQRNALITSLGGKSAPRIEFGDLKKLNTQVQDGDSFLLCSDGFWAYFDETELARIIADYPAKEALVRLIKLARERAEGEGDNLSAALLKFQDEKPASDYLAIMEARTQARQAAEQEEAEGVLKSRSPSDAQEGSLIQRLRFFLGGEGELRLRKAFRRLREFLRR